MTMGTTSTTSKPDDGPEYLSSSLFYLTFLASYLYLVQLIDPPSFRTPPY
jgi:hypothetical protein